MSPADGGGRSADLVVTEMTGQHVLPGRIAPIRVRLCWSRTDPHVVRMSFPRHDREWLLSRELLDAGLDLPVGVGDIAVCPYGALVQVRFDVPDGTAVIRLDQAAVLEFLTVTFRAVDDTTAAQITGAAIDSEFVALLSKEWLR